MARESITGAQIGAWSGTEGIRARPLPVRKKMGWLDVLRGAGGQCEAGEVSKV